MVPAQRRARSVGAPAPCGVGSVVSGLTGSTVATACDSNGEGEQNGRVFSATALAAIAYPTIVKVHLGPLAISPHGVGIAVGFLLGARLMLPEAERKGIGEDQVYPLLTRAAIGSIVGARIAYIISHLAADPSRGDAGYIHHPLDMFKVWQGGISLLGGFIGAILLALPEMRKRRLSFWTIMDAAAPGMALGVIIGRIGDLIVGDHLGKQTSLFFGFKCPSDVTRTASPCLPGPGAVVHQTALYDFLLTILLIGALLWLRRRPRYPGFVISLFGAWYGCQRILEDFLREDKHILGTGLTGSQITAIITVLFCLWHLTFVRRSPRWGHWDERSAPAGSEPVTTTVGPEPTELEE
ncbi:MAG: phosphatidylglycerol---prolipoprotein diacylglyceryl transferase [Acidimicrobiaceae bacterium]|nr:phosphatidylglycerol---prolipoprotein diacylglyceryl transferase [Acidimicrobiaceae bacterium]